MTLGEKVIFMVLALLESGAERDTIKEKVETLLEHGIKKPEVLLDDKQKEIFQKKIEKAKAQGKIV